MAPSPTGRLHIGTARTALFNWLFARHNGGTFVLRLEDTDRTRSSDEFALDIVEGLRWLGLDWDEGPEVGGPYGPYLQSQKLPRYQEVAAELLARGLAYPCYCTPEEITERRNKAQAEGLPGVYDQRCLALSTEERARFEVEGKPKALRFLVPEEGSIGWNDLIRGEVSFENALLDDFVLLKADGYPTYLLAVVVDDYDMRISHILRGEDIISATPRQLHIYRAMGWPAPEFAHLPMILAPDRSKMSKRHGATALTQYRELGYLPEAIVNFIALLGWSPGDDREILTREELIAAFSIEGLGKSGAVFDLEKLNWMNGVYLRELAGDAYLRLALPLLKERYPKAEETYASQAALLLKERLKTLAELPALADFFFCSPTSYEEKGARKWFQREGAKELLVQARQQLASLETFDAPALESALRQVADSLALQPGPVIHTVRLALTGRTTGPGLFELMEVLGQQESLQRLITAQAYMEELPAQTA
jgi:glutamyl-tRNA synthetase